ncbi:MAG TPA: hypothetical protein VG817_12720 [Gemmatimonadales bacterium]|nr:hypothetical protein [Gemmatimonadales bacterium]
MYRIRLASGEEAVYRTVQELAQAVASGMVSPDAEVYHKAANRWLPIHTHPDYRAAMATGQQTAINPAISIPGPAGPAEATTSPPKSTTPPKGPAIPPPTRQRTSKTTAVPLDLDSFELLDPMAEPEPAKQQTRQSAAIPLLPVNPSSTIKTTAVNPPGAPPGPPGSSLPAEAEMIDLTAPEPPIILAPPPMPAEPAPPRKPLLDRSRIVLVASIAALVFAVGITGLIVMQSRPRAPGIIDTTQQAAIAPSVDSVADTTVTRVPRVPDTSTAARPVLPVRVTARLPVQPDTYPTPLKPRPAAVATPRRDTAPKPAAAPAAVAATPKPPPVSKTPSYYQAYADARQEMDQSLAYVNFRRVFAPGRFSSMDSLRATKRMVVAAGNILRVYRGREVQLEQTFRPDDPGGRNSLREPFETSEASRALLADVDSLFTLLVSQEGEITVTGTEIRFRSTRAARAYNEVRREILQTLSTWRDSAEAANRVTMPRLVLALGTFQPPVGR